MGGVIKDFNNPNTSTATKAGEAVGLGFATYEGVKGTINNFKAGGARGIVGGIASAAGTAAMLDPEPISKAILTGVAFAGTVLKDILGDPKAERQKEIDRTLRRNADQAPPTINASQSLSGFNLAFDKSGKPLLTNQTGYDVTATTTRDLDGQYVTLPGQVRQTGNSAADHISPSAAPMYRGASPSVTTINVNIDAMDTQSILDRSPDIGMAVYKELNQAGPLGQRIQMAVFGA